MSEEKPPEALEEKKKSPMIKIIVLIVGMLVVLTAAIGGTLFLTGAFSKKPVDAEAALLEHEESSAQHASPAAHSAPPAPPAHGAPDAKGDSKSGAKGDSKSGAKGSQPQKKPLPENAQTRFEKSYMELDDKKALVANVANSRKVMQIALSLMTQYDDRVFQNVEKHRAALRSTVLNVLRQVTEAELTKPEFRTELAQRLRDKINAELERLENFGGIEEVFFTEFVYQ